MKPGLFAKTVRPAILTVSRSDGVRRAAQRLPVTNKVVHRFVPGETLDDIMNSVAALRSSGRLVSVDYLGEDVTDVGGAKATMRAYLELLSALADRPDATHNGVRPLEVSLKLSALGQALHRDGSKVALENAHTICARAEQAGVWVTVDAEDHTTTESTLSIAADLRAEYPWLGVVLQAYLRRTLGDCEHAAATGARIRLCKGAYDEPVSVAYRDAEEVTDSYLRCLRVLMAGSGYPMVASHDPVIVEAATVLADECGRGAERYEHQMLYGISDDVQRRLTQAGSRLRVYVPFGAQWYGYFMRRLAERPANLAFFMRALAQRER